MSAGDQKFKGMTSRTIEELDAVRASCRALVNSRSGASALVAALPIPGPDVTADVSIVLEMIPAINRRFGLAPEQIAELSPAVQRVVLASISRASSSLVGKVLTKEVVVVVLKRIGLRIAAKFAARIVPLVGSALSAGISFTAMRMVGNRHVDTATPSRAFWCKAAQARPWTQHSVSWSRSRRSSRATNRTEQASLWIRPARKLLRAHDVQPLKLLLRVGDRSAAQWPPPPAVGEMIGSPVSMNGGTSSSGMPRPTVS